MHLALSIHYPLFWLWYIDLFCSLIKACLFSHWILIHFPGNNSKIYIRINNFFLCYFLFVCFVTPYSAQALLLALCLGIIPGNIRGHIEFQWLILGQLSVKQALFLLYALSSPKKPFFKISKNQRNDTLWFNLCITYEPHATC